MGFSIKRSGRLAAFAISLALLAGLSPVLFNLLIDPYDRAPVVDLDLNKERVSEKAHYPLWKMLRYSENAPDLVVLGDSRARAYRDKYWHELGLHGAFNFAYGGANIDEMYATFEHIKNDPAIRTLVVGMQLRSFDRDHKAGQNRVPEAIRLSGNAFEYYASWFVTKIGWRNISTRYPDVATAIADMRPRLVRSAQAAEAGLTAEEYERISASCGCVFIGNEGVTRRVYQHAGIGGWHGFGDWSGIFDLTLTPRDLPRKFERQVTKNARSDWKSFEFDEVLWAKVTAIAEWAKQENVNLLFVIPPTIVEMQQQIAAYGREQANLSFRLRLAALAPVVDFDFDNAVTRDIDRFTDAYHFDAATSRLLVGEITQVLSEPRAAAAIARARRGDIACPITQADQKTETSDGLVVMQEGTACRIWRAVE